MVATPSGISGISATPAAPSATTPAPAAAGTDGAAPPPEPGHVLSARIDLQGTYRHEHRSESRVVRRVAVAIDGEAHPATGRT